MFWKNSYCLVVILTLMVVWSSGQSICACVFLALNVMNLIIVFREFKYFPSDMAIYVLWGLPVLQVFVIGVDLNLVGGMCKQPPPVPEGPNYGVEFQPVNVVVLFGFVQSG